MAPQIDRPNGIEHLSSQEVLENWRYVEYFYVDILLFVSWNSAVGTGAR